MQLQFYDSLYEPNEIRSTDIVFEHIHGIVVVFQNDLALGLVLGFDELFDLVGLVGEDLSAVVLEDTL